MTFWYVSSGENDAIYLTLEKSSDLIFFISQLHLQETETTSKGSRLNGISYEILHLFFPASRNFNWYLLIKHKQWLQLFEL